MADTEESVPTPEPEAPASQSKSARPGVARWVLWALSLIVVAQISALVYFTMRPAPTVPQVPVPDVGPPMGGPGPGGGPPMGGPGPGGGPPMGGPGPSGGPGGPGGGPGGPPMTMTDLASALTAGVLSSDPLTAQQKSGLLDVTRKVEAAQLAMGEAVQNMYGALTDEQRSAAWGSPHAPIPPDKLPPVTAPGMDPFLELIIQTLEPIAGKTGRTPAAPSGTIPERLMIIEGIVFLQSQPATKLSPEQAKTVLDAARVIKQKSEEIRTLETQAIAQLTPGQLEKLQKVTPGDRQAGVTRLFARWLESAP